MVTPQEILALPVDPVSGVQTIRGYLVELLLKVWDERECFDGKRPFGNSDWEYDLLAPLVRKGLIVGSFNHYGLIKCDENLGRALIGDAINALGDPT